MTDVTDNEQPWMPEPVSSEAFTGPEGWANINRAPYDQVSGVIYKRAANIKRVRTTLATTETDPASPLPDYAGSGEEHVRWIFSEQPGSEEGILNTHRFGFLQDVELLPGASTQQTAHPERDTVLYVIAGEGRLLHRPAPGSPNLSRPLRPFDAVLIRGEEWFSIANASGATPLRMIILGLTSQEQRAGR